MNPEDASDRAPGVPTDESPAVGAAAPAAEAEIDRLRQQLAHSEEEARANYDKFVRQCAELENFKKRMQREKAEALRFACEPLIRELLPVIDNLERALTHADEANGASVREGVRLVSEAMLALLERHGVKRIDALGQPFDPSRHEAMAQVASDEEPPNRVVEQHHSGYLLHDRLLRPALVTVSGPKNRDQVETEENSD